MEKEKDQGHHHAETYTGPDDGTELDHDTPRSEVPTISLQPNPTLHSMDGGLGTEDGYFTLQPPQGQPSASLSSFQAITTPTPSAQDSDGHGDGAPSLMVSQRLSTLLDVSDRPGVHRDVSQASTASVDSSGSATTVTGEDHTGEFARLVHTYSGPRYPNQAFSALQQQRYPPPHLPPTLRTHSLHPAHTQTFRQAIASLHSAGVRTADSSPSPTPGLFNPTTAPPALSHLGVDESGYYASPFLHYTHRQAPKETHTADVDIDPISGRKLINNYEIIDELGRGTHGKVKLGRNLETHEYVAIKIVERYSKKRRLGKLGNAEDKVKKEVAILKKARHPNIVALLEVIDDPTRKKVYIVLERVDLGEITWRAEAPKEVALVECRRYEREARGVFDDQIAEAEDRAIMEDAKSRRLKAQRREMRRLRRERRIQRAGPQPWSFEFGGDTDDDDSDLERASRVSTTTTEFSEDRSAHVSRAPTPVPQADSETTEHATPVKATAPPLDIPGTDRRSLEGTMYGSYEDEDLVLRAPSLANSVKSFGPHDLRDPDYVHHTASEVLDSDVHPDLLYVPCMAMHTARVAFRDTVLGLQYLHWQGIIHRDIKPPNLLQTKDHRIKISDFGVSYLGRPIGDDQAENLSESDAQDFDEAKELAKTVGTAAFYAPELCYTDIPADGEKVPSVGKAIDVWALGITLFCMLFGRTPFIDSEYVVMRRIADEEIYIPRKRLRPVDPRPKSRPSSHGRHYSPASSGRRAEFELVYEEIDDALLDLLHKLLVKDPDKRITLEGVRHHPWVLQDIPNKQLWLDETDPARQAQGQKIQVSKEELQHAVVPVKLVERIRSGLKKTVGGLMSGLGRASSGGRHSSPSLHGSHPPSAGSSSSTISQDGRRNSLHGDESIYSALKASREHEHPLAQSVTVSPVQSPQELMSTSASTPTGAPTRRDVASQLSSNSRSVPPDRARSIMSTSTSVRTIRPSDVLQPDWPGSEPPSPVLAATSNESSTVALVGGLLSGAGRRILQSVRERSSIGRGADDTERSTSQGPTEAGDPHADPSVAITNASAAGHLDPPTALKNITPGSSPVMLRSHSPVALDRHGNHRMAVDMEREDSSASLAARRRLDTSFSSPTHPPESTGRAIHESTTAEYTRAEDEWLRRRIREDRDRASAANEFQANGPLSPNSCPPSPDDDFYSQQQAGLMHAGANSSVPCMETSPTSRRSSILPNMTPSSSDDRLEGGTPMTRSTHSIPSVTTVDSETHQEMPSDRTAAGEPLTITDVRKLQPFSIIDEEGYAGDHAVDTDEDDDEYEDSSDDDGGLQMVRRRSVPQRRTFSTSSTTMSTRNRQRRETGSSAFSKKSSRSGSNNTMRKVRSNDSRGEDCY